MGSGPGNEFNIEKLPDGRIKVTSPGGFSPELHLKAEEFLEFIHSLCGDGAVETKTLAPTLGSLQHGHTHQHGKHKHKH